MDFATIIVGVSSGSVNVNPDTIVNKLLIHYFFNNILIFYKKKDLANCACSWYDTQDVDTVISPGSNIKYYNQKGRNHFGKHRSGIH